MDDKRDVFDIIREFPETQEIKPELLDKAKKRAEELYVDKSNQSRHLWQRWTKIAACLLLPCFVVIAVFSTMLIRKGQEAPEKFFSVEDIVSEDIPSISDFIVENNFSYEYFVLENAQEYSTKNIIKETGGLAYIQQSMIVFNEESFESVVLFIVPTKGKFEIFEKYINLDKTIQIDESIIKYSVNQNEQAVYITDAKLVLNDVTYFLTLQSGKENRLKFYMEKLLR